MAWVSRHKGKKAWNLFIGGKWKKPKQYLDVYSPVTDSTFAFVPKANTNEAEQALRAASKARRKIREMPAHRRAEILEEASERLKAYAKDLEKILIYEAGKPVKQARGEIRASAIRLKFAAQECEEVFGEAVLGDASPFKENKFAIVVREPLGTILAITPFNYPLMTSVSKVAPAIASGNSVVLKPATDTPISAYYLARVFEDVGLPEGVLNVVSGKGSEIGDTLVESQLVNGISFTGSTAVGKAIAKKAGLKKLHLELGGKAPALILEDADLDLAAKEVVAGSLKFSGQRCDAISRVLVEESVADDFVTRVSREMRKWKVGDPRKSKTDLGPLINRRAVQKVSDLVDDALEKGADLVMGGKSRGCYYWPTLLDNVPLDARIAWEETFGPVVPIIRVRDMDEALKISNDSDYGLDASVFTRDINKAMKLALALEDGEITINAHPTHGLGIFPFGGVKDSGMGREGIHYSILEMTEVKTIVMRKG